MPSPASRRPVRRRLLLGVVVAGALGLAVEGVSWLALTLGEGSFAAVRRERSRRAGWRPPAQAPATDDLLAELDPTGGGVPREALHPFLGYVVDPALNVVESRRERGLLEVTDEGFFRPPGPPPPPDPGAVEVALFGGSVAMLLSFEGRERLLAEIGRAPRYAGRPLGLGSYALGGYKQPQQLATLAYLLARGRRPDLVIVLDGFNEVVLPATENLVQRVALDYPRGWPHRVETVSDPATLREIGRLAVRREERGLLARRASRAPWRWSPTLLLAWRAADRRLGAAIAAAERGLASRPAGPGDYATRGDFDAPADDEELYRRLAGLWFESSLQMHRLCEANGIPYVHFLQPNQYVPGSKPMGREERARAFVDDHPYREPVVEGYPHLVEAGRELVRRGVAFHDLTRLFEGVEAPLYHDTCCHLNRAGSERLAAAMGERIVGELAGGAAADRPGR